MTREASKQASKQAYSIKTNEVKNQKFTKWHEDEMNMNNVVKWRRFIVPVKVEQVNVNLFSDTGRTNNIKIAVSEMEMSDNEMGMRWNI